MGVTTSVTKLIVSCRVHYQEMNRRDYESMKLKVDRV